MKGITREFELPHGETGKQVKVSINADDDLYFVSIGGKFIGALERDLHSPNGYSSTDAELQPFMAQIVAHLDESFGAG
ncbi:hypothetical protein ACFOG5_24065 [Pedobacter fastidiosus]|uniref:Uncharacterized protein n=1 Tax=Pedobacter fastidiosus TaxID=2765361 RepID=A0ABR7KY75_9SPHI|nr:hypothetical protein [Pedobacter fastidiosus]MBC6112628.1 hypothetical protein [Pedobacter fastidiosus]